MESKQQILSDINKPFDAFLVCAGKDLIKLPHVVKAVIEHVVDLGKIHICTPRRIEPLPIDYPILYHTDKSILNIDPFKWRFRPNWIYQQMLKLFQDVTETNFYLTVDCDSILVRDLRFFNDHGQPVWYKGWDQNESPYYNFNSKMIGIQKVVDHTFLADMNFMNKTVVKYMLDINGMSVVDFINKSFNIVDMICHPSEADLYGQFAATYFPDMYEVREMKQFNNGKHNDNPNAIIWDSEEISDTINKNECGDYDVIQFHTWCLGVSDDWE